MILRALAMSPSASQNASSRLMFVLRPSIETVRLTTVDFGTIAQPYPGLLAGLNHLCETHGSGLLRLFYPAMTMASSTGLGSGIDKDRPDLVSTVASGVLVASTRPAAVPTILRRFWSMTVNGPMTRSDRVATLEEASEIRSDRIAIFSKNLSGRMILSKCLQLFGLMLRRCFRRARNAWKAGRRPKRGGRFA